MSIFSHNKDLRTIFFFHLLPRPGFTGCVPQEADFEMLTWVQRCIWECPWFSAHGRKATGQEEGEAGQWSRDDTVSANPTGKSGARMVLASSPQPGEGEGAFIFWHHERRAAPNGRVTLGSTRWKFPNTDVSQQPSQ